MRPIFLIGLFICFNYISAFAKEISLIGKVTNPINKQIILVCPSTELGASIKRDTLLLNAQNAFQFKLDVKQAFFAELYHGNIAFPVFIDPEHPMSVVLSIKEGGEAGVSFVGPGAKENTFYLAYRQHLNTILNNTEISDFQVENAKDYHSFVKNLAKAKYNFLKKYQIENKIDLSSTFIAWVKNDIAYLSAYYLLQYPSLVGLNYFLFQESKMGGNLYNFNDPNNKAIFKWATFSDSIATSLKKELAFLSAIPIHNEGIMHHPAYRKFLEAYLFNYKFYTAIKGEFPKTYKEEYELANKHFKGSPRYFLQSLILKHGIDNHLNDIQSLYETFIAGQAPLLLKKEIYAYHYEAKRTVKGEAMTLFAFRQIGGQAVDTKLLKNKISYLFFWNNDNETAKYEMPAFRRIAKKMQANKNVNLLLINTNPSKNPKDDLAKLKPYKLTEFGVHYLLWNKETDPHLFKKYLIRTLPEFFIVDPKGLIISGRTFAPMSGRVEKLLRELVLEYGLER